MNETSTEIGIVGAGVCGLWTARSLRAQNRSTCVFDKARGVGGRLATRRTDHARFDHGAQFYILKPETAAAHAAWGEAAELWLEDGPAPKYRARAGMTALTKILARDVDVRLGRRVTEIEGDGDRWITRFEDDARFAQNVLVLTCPVPQSLELLTRSRIAFDPKLAELTHAKALVALIEDVRARDGSPLVIDPGFDIGTIANQFAKGLSPTPAWTVTMTPEFSHAHFDAPADQVLSLIDQRLRALDPTIEYARPQLKAWRYAQPENWRDDGCVEVAPNLFLAGDAFGGPSINGALRSADRLIERLTQKV